MKRPMLLSLQMQMEQSEVNPSEVEKQSGQSVMNVSRKVKLISSKV